MSNQTNTTPVNVLNWFEISVSDVPRAMALYGAMLDTKLATTEFGGTTMVLLGQTGCLIGGAKTRAAKGGTVVYFRAPDGVQRTLARAVEAGAKIVQPLTAIDPHGTIATIEDLDGNIIGLHAEPGK